MYCIVLTPYTERCRRLRSSSRTETTWAPHLWPEYEFPTSKRHLTQAASF